MDVSDPLRQRYRLREGVRQRGLRVTEKATEALQSIREARLPIPRHLLGHDMQGRPRQPDVREFRGRQEFDKDGCCRYSSFF